MSLGNEIRKAREATGLSQEQLALEAGLHRTYISLLERGKRSPTIDVLLRICKVLGTSASELIGRIETDGSSDNA